MTHHNTEQSDSRQITSVAPTFTTTDCLNQGHNESSFPGLNVIALQKFDIPYDELTPALQGHVREESVRRAGNDLLAAVKEAKQEIEYLCEHSTLRLSVVKTRPAYRNIVGTISLAEGK